MANWKDNINEETKAAVNLDGVEKRYLSQLNKNLASGFPEGVALRKTKKEMILLLDKYGIPNCEIIHLLHFCIMAIYPRAYAGCGCHSAPAGYLKR